MGGPPGGPSGVERPTQRTEGVKWPTQWSGRGRESNPVVREGSGGPHGRPGDSTRGAERVRKPTRKSGSDW